MKIGRNDPCHCGSKKKFKKCCWSKEPRVIPASAKEQISKKMVKIQQEQTKLKYMGIHFNFVRPIMHKGKDGKTNKFWALGSKLYYGGPPNETYHEFLIRVLKMTLGQEWTDEQKVQKEKHFIYKCVEKFNKWKRDNHEKGGKSSGDIYQGTPDGWTKSLLLLAFDICSLVHTMQLPEQLLNRLKNRDQYQGARYEIAVAAIFARLNYKINFLDDKVKSEKHCEFYATKKEEGISIAVEAKSRHREGIIHEKGEADLRKAMKGSVTRLLNRAHKQNPDDRPYIIFIDLNTPMTPGIKFEEKQWFKDIKKMMAIRDKESGKDNPTPENAVFFTNYSYHYQTENESMPGEHLDVIPFYPKYKIENDLFQWLPYALDNYGYVPNLDIEDKENSFPLD